MHHLAAPLGNVPLGNGSEDMMQWLRTACTLHVYA